MKRSLASVGAFFLLFTAVYLLSPSFFSKKHEVGLFAQKVLEQKVIKKTEEEKPLVTHLKTPESVKAVYMSSWVAGTVTMRAKITALIDTTEINSVVIDIKDYTGKLSYKPKSPYLLAIGSEENRIRDISELIRELHSKGIYIIGRIAVFQDPYLVEKRPDLAVKKKSDTNTIWRDKKNIPWLDPGAKEIWEYTVAIGRDAYELGFDELNFDYIRFPSDGNMSDIYYPKSDGKVKSEVMKEFFSYLNENLKNPKTSILEKELQWGEKRKTSTVVTSADLFGMTTTSRDDLNIGQVLEDALPFFDYVSPMVYPSHYPPTFHGYKNPAEHPYEIVKFAMDSAVIRATNASTSPSQIRPWLQDFNLGAIYTKEMVRSQIQATYDAGLTSWMLWDPANTYTQSALLPAENL